MTRYYPVPFYFTVPGTSTNGQVSYPLINVSELAEIYMIFPAGTSLNLLYRFYWLGQVPTTLITLPQTGQLTQPEISDGPYVGDALSYSVPYQMVVPDSAKYLAMYATNNTASTLSAQAVAIVTT